MTPTPHNNARPNDIAETALMPGDPLRAKFIAENFLTNVVKYNDVRGMFGYTGQYEGKKVSVQGSGMGMPSMGIYSYELFNFYGVDNIIRIGTTGGMAPSLSVRDVVLAAGACTDSNYAAHYKLPGSFAPIASHSLLEKALSAARKIGVNAVIGNVLSSDVFYHNDPDALALWVKMGVLSVEMECAALYMNAAAAGKRALGILTVSDLMFTDVTTTAAERETTFVEMATIALETALEI
ncbi:MAG: purine-nucleoside phosphorylase [Clostridiales bacterium]|jgi:purine-nucleoside phosphorylase|nr:purine-nucleoside phosphorylase [Clostridiales bacterium]